MDGPRGDLLDCIIRGIAVEKVQEEMLEEREKEVPREILKTIDRSGTSGWEIALTSSPLTEVTLIALGKRPLALFSLVRVAISFKSNMSFVSIPRKNE